MRHAFFNAPHHYDNGRLRRKRLISEGRESEGEGDRHAGKDQKGDDANEENQQIQIAKIFENWLEQIQTTNHKRADTDCADDMSPVTNFK